MITFTFLLFKNTTPDGPAFACMPIEAGKRMLLAFSGDDPVETVTRAKEWVNREFDTPERRARTKAAAEARKAARSSKATAVAAEA